MPKKEAQKKKKKKAEKDKNVISADLNKQSSEKSSAKSNKNKHKNNKVQKPKKGMYKFLFALTKKQLLKIIVFKLTFRWPYTFSVQCHIMVSFVNFLHSNNNSIFTKCRRNS